jgi:predicted ester cyclase
MADPNNETKVFGLSADDRHAVTLYRAVSDHNPDSLDEAVTPDWQDIPLASDQAPGREGVKPLIRGFSAVFPDAKAANHEIIRASGRAAGCAEVSGTHSAEWFGVRATGIRFVLPIQEFHRIEDGRLTHTWHLDDWFGWLHQVGTLVSNKETAR